MYNQKRVVYLHKQKAKHKKNKEIMESQVIKIELRSELATFTFESYTSLLDFEKNNWKQLGETSYNVFRKYEDGDIVELLHEGINASCFLAQDIED